MRFKKLLFVFFVLLAAFVFVACDEKEEPTDNDPVIVGAKDITIEKGEAFVPLAGITATDEEDGDLTEAIVYTGNVNVNKVGEYQATYTVVDSDGNEAKVTITVTVVLTDTTAPFLTGVDDVEIVVGDTEFDVLDGVEANDTIDGNLTSEITVVGEVEPWKLGEYTITYKVSDNSGNEKTADRKVTVSLGDFIVRDAYLEVDEVEFVAGVYEAEVEGGEIDGVLADFAIAKLTFKASASAATILEFTLTNGTSLGEVEVGTAEKSYTIYFRISEEIEEGFLKLETEGEVEVTDLVFAFCEAKDVTPPVITAPTTVVVLPGNIDDPEVLKKFVLNGVSANDDIDQNVTRYLDVDFGSIVLGEFFGEAEVTIFVLDSSLNRAEVTRPVEFAEMRNTNLIVDPEFDDEDLSLTQWGLAGGGGEPELVFEDGVMIHRLTKDDNPGWDSASSPFFRTTTEVLRPYNWYLLKFDIKVDTARKMTVRIGLDTTEGAGWIENFAGGSNTPVSPTPEWQTVYIMFYIHAEKSEALQSNSVKFEFKLGSFDWGANERINPAYFDNMQVYLVTNENNPPELSLVKGLPTTFGKDEDAPDLTEYVYAYDVEDGGEIEITEDHIDASALNMSEVGEYEVVYTVADSDGEEATITLVIKVIAEKDTLAPVLSEKAGLVKEIDQFSTEFTAADLLTAVIAQDDIDGEIAITPDMIDGAVDLTKAGTYVLIYTVSDSSGNEATLELTFVVNDKEAPKFAGRTTLTVTVGDVINPFTLVTCSDNVDGAITLSLANLSGYDGFLDATGKVLKDGTFTLVYEATDAAGNKGTHELVVTANPKGETELVDDEEVYDFLALQVPIDSGSSSMATITYGDDGAVIEVSDVGGWASAAKIKGLLTLLVPDEVYKIRIKVKADEARSLVFNVGQGLWSEPWFDKFTFEDGSEIVVTTEYVVYELIFTYDKPFADGGPAIEFCFGKGSHAGDKAGNDIYIQEFKIIKMKEVPVVPENVALDILATEPQIDSGSANMATVNYDDGVAHIEVSDVGGWASAAKMKILLPDLVPGETYQVKITVKADEARNLVFNIGQSLWSEPWFNKFTMKDDATITITGDYMTYYLTFVYDKDFQDSGPAMEFCFGYADHAGDKAGNDIYVKEFKILNVYVPEYNTLVDLIDLEKDIDSGSTGNATVDYDDGVAHIEVSNVGEWASFTKIKYTFSMLEYGKTYVLMITAKADEERALVFNIGQGLWSDPWMAKFTVDPSNTVVVTDEYETYYITFEYDKEFQDGGPTMEFCFGKTGHAGDKAGNDIYIKDLKILTFDPVEEDEEVVVDILAKEPDIDSGAASNATVAYDDGVAHIEVSNVGTYASYAKIKIALPELQFGNFYALKITVKADEARNLKFNIGQGLWSEPWFDKFTLEEEDTIEVSDEYVTYYFNFEYDKAKKDGGPTLEFCFGAIDHDGDKAGNDIYINEFKIIKK